MKKITTTIALLAAAGVVQMTSAQIVPPGTTGLLLENGASIETGTEVGGVWNFAGSVGTYDLTVATGSSLSAGASPEEDLDVDITSAGTGALYIIFTDGTFGPTHGGYTLTTTAFNGTGTISTYAYQNTTLLGGSVSSPSSQTLNSSGTISGDDYNLSIEDVIHGSVQSADSTLTVSSVPEASTVMAGALMLLPLGIGAFRAIRKDRTA